MGEDWGTFGPALDELASVHRKRLVCAKIIHPNKDEKQAPALAGAVRLGGHRQAGRTGTCPMTSCPAGGGQLASDMARGKEETVRMSGSGEFEKAADLGT